MADHDSNATSSPKLGSPGGNTPLLRSGTPLAPPVSPGQDGRHHQRPSDGSIPIVKDDAVRPVPDPAQRLAAFVVASAFRPLPNPVPVDEPLLRHLPPSAMKLRRSLTTSDLSGQLNPVNFCLSQRSWKLLEDHTRTMLADTAPTLENQDEIFKLWHLRIIALLHLGLAPQALAETSSLQIAQGNGNPPWPLRVACAALPALTNNPYAALDQLHVLLRIARASGRAEGNRLSPGGRANQWAADVYRQMAYIVCDLADPRLLASLAPKWRVASGRNPEALLELALLHMESGQAQHAEAIIEELSQFDPDSGRSSYLRATFLMWSGKYEESRTEWNELAGRVYEAAQVAGEALELLNVGREPVPVDRLPGTPTAGDSKLLKAMAPLALAIAANRAVASAAACASAPLNLPSQTGAVPGIERTMGAAAGILRSLARASGYPAPIVTNLATLIEITMEGVQVSDGSGYSSGPVSQASVADRKRTLLVDMARAVDAVPVASLRI